MIACRARKDQKAKLTRLVREGNQEVVTLGIGDGANDVEMIRAAHIGVGIIGKEGTQAVNNADYAISQFRFLARLILVYGHRSYRGITLASLLIFYKNIVFTLIQFFYTFLCGFSGTRNQSYIAIFWYNTLITAMGPIILSVTDRDISDSNCSQFPQLHRQGIDHRLFSVKSFLLYFAKAIYESLIIGWFLYWIFDHADYPTGTIDVWMFGMITVTINILVVNLSVSIEQSIMTPFSVICFWVALFIWFILILSNSRSVDLYPNYYYALDLMLHSPLFYLSFLLCTICALLPTMIVKAVQREWRPTLGQFIQDVQVRKVSPEVIKTALENMEKQRSLELELKTMKNKPQEAKVPELMQVTPELVESMEYELECSRSSALDSSTGIDKTPYQLMNSGKMQRSIRSIAGLRALTICDQLHGPSYDSESINSEAQSLLISQINSHNWREFAKPDLMDGIKKQMNAVSPITIIKQISDTLKKSEYGKNLKLSLGVVKEEPEEEKQEVVIEDLEVIELEEEILLDDIPSFPDQASPVELTVDQSIN